MAARGASPRKAAPAVQKRASKTRERILKAALLMFNQEGEEAISLVDIAGEIGISPGNLYYHYKGKESLLAELFDRFEEELVQVLSVPGAQKLEISDSWIFLYIIFEEIYDFRFFYLNLASIMDRVPSLKARMARLMRAKETMIRDLIQHMVAEEIVVISDEQTLLQASRAALTFTYWPSWQQLMAPEIPTPHAIHEGVYMVFSALAPFMGTGQAEFETLLAQFKQHMVKTPA